MGKPKGFLNEFSVAILAQGFMDFDQKVPKPNLENFVPPDPPHRSFGSRLVVFAEFFVNSSGAKSQTFPKKEPLKSLFAQALHKLVSRKSQHVICIE